MSNLAYSKSELYCLHFFSLSTFKKIWRCHKRRGGGERDGLNHDLNNTDFVNKLIYFQHKFRNTNNELVSDLGDIQKKTGMPKTKYWKTLLLKGAEHPTEFIWRCRCSAILKKTGSTNFFHSSKRSGHLVILAFRYTILHAIITWLAVQLRWDA